MPEDSVPIRRLRELESVLARSAEGCACLRLLQEILSEPIGADPRSSRTDGTGACEPPDAFGAAVLQSLPTQIALLNAQGTIVAVNQAWRRFAENNGGAADSGLGVGANYLEVCARAQGERCDEANAALSGIRSVLAGQQSLFDLEYPCHAPGIRRWFLMQVTPLPVVPRGALVTHLEITGRKLEEDLARRQQAQLAQVARMHAVGALASAVAHEISQPLAAIGIYSNAAAHMLESGSASTADLAVVLHQIEGQIHRAGEILGRMRELTRWRTAEKTPIDLCETAVEAVRLALPMATGRQVDIALDLPEEPVRVSADRVQIVQAVINLLFNGIEAIELAGSQERRILVRVRRDAQGAAVTVQDSGPGIRRGWGERIFDMFETDKETGTGMGLTIGRSLIEAHGGRLWADTECTAGATFHFTLPGIPEGCADSE